MWEDSDGEVFKFLRIEIENIGRGEVCGEIRCLVWMLLCFFIIGIFM